MTPYEILGVSVDATPEEIKAAWKKKAFSFHPDRGGDPEDFKRALRAYECLRSRPPRPPSVSVPVQTPQPEPEAQKFADAYYDAWFDVPGDVRFWLNALETIHSASLFVAAPFFFGGLLMLLGGLINARGNQSAIGLLLSAACGTLIAIAKSDYWQNTRFDLQDRYARRNAAAAIVVASAVKNPTVAKKSQTTDDADTKGRSFGCLAVCVALIIFAFAVPAKDADDSGGRNVFVCIVASPAILALIVLLANSNSEKNRRREHSSSDSCTTTLHLQFRS